MPNLSTRLETQLATLRHLKLLVVVLILSNIGLGALSVYFLRTIDQRYSRLIGMSLPQLTELQTLTVASVDAARSAGINLFDAPENKRGEMLQKAQAAFGRERVLRTRFLATSSLQASTQERAELQDSGEAFSQSGTELMALFTAGKVTEANRMRLETLRPAFDRYIAATTKAADLLQAESLRASQRVAAKAGSILALTVGLASWPVIVFCALLLFTVVVIIGFSVFFHSREPGSL